MISSKVKASTSQPVTLNGHLSTLGLLTGLRKSRLINFWQQCCGIDGAIDWQLKSLLTLCVYVAGFGKSGLIYIHVQ